MGLKNLMTSILVTGPYKINSVPTRNVNQGYLLATTLKVDLTEINQTSFNDFLTKSALWTKSIEGNKRNFESNHNSKDLNVSNIEKLSSDSTNFTSRYEA